MKICKNRLYVISAELIILIFMFIFMLFVWNNSISQMKWTRWILFASIILIIMQTFVFHYLKIKLLDMRCVFIYLLYIFLLGRVYLHALGQENNYNLFFYRYSASELYKSSLYSLTFIQAMFCGFLFFTDKSNAKSIDNSGLYNKINDKKLFYTGVFLFLISFPCEIYKSAKTIITQSMTDSYVGENLIEVNGVIATIGRLTVVALIFIVCSKYLKKNKALFIILLYSGMEFTLSVFSGARSYAVIAILVLIICFIDLYKVKFNYINIIAVVVIAYLGVCAISAISDVRTTGDISLYSFFISFVDNLFSGDILYRVLLEFGNTQNTIGMGIKTFYGSDSFYYGITFFSAWLAAVPGIQRIFPGINLYYNSIDIMQNILPSYYFGGSLALDTYINFGVFGIIASVFLGIFISKFMKINTTKGLSSYALFYSKYYILLRMVRCGVSEITRLLVYTYILYFVASSVVGRLSKK